jgi:hypothetical protein
MVRHHAILNRAGFRPALKKLRLALLFLCGFWAKQLWAQSSAQDTFTTDFYGIDSNDDLVNLADLLGATTFYNNGIYGQKTTAWIVDAQLVGTNLFTAENFTNLTYTDVPPGVLTAPGDHATWCAALLGGYSPPGYYLNTGMAPGTTLGSAALATATNADGSFTISTESLSAYIYAATHGDVLSTSIGDSSDPAGAGILSGLLDSLAAANPNTTMVAAAGNGSNAGMVGGPASGYNSISVGALDGPTNYPIVASFSSRGPQPTAWYDGTNTYYYDGGAATRPGVDLVAPGTDIVMPATMTVGSNSISFSYYSISGTSFATPLVAGGAALLDSAAKTYFASSLTNAATQSVVIKAVLMNSADKLPGWNNGQQIVNGVITTTQALDYAMGAGRMNLNTAFTQYTSSAVVTTSGGISLSGFNESVDNIGWAYGTVLLGGVNNYTLASDLFAGQQVAVTLDWLRSQTWNSQTSDYVDLAQAELDLMVYQVLSGGTDQLVAESISPVSTTQELYFALPNSGTYTIEVNYPMNLFDFSGNYDSQNYGLAWSVSGVPEPGSMMLFVAGGSLILLRSHLRRKA